MHINNHKNVSLSDRQKLWGLIGGCGESFRFLFMYLKISEWRKSANIFELFRL